MLKALPNNSVDLIVTSPPYDEVRDYNGNYSFNLHATEEQVKRVLKTGLAKTVKRLREKRGLFQKKLTRLADISNNTIINIEAGKQQNPAVHTIKKIAKALKVPIEVLIK